jgi:hypothetical protein
MLPNTFSFAEEQTIYQGTAFEIALTEIINIPIKTDDKRGQETWLVAS